MTVARRWNLYLVVLVLRHGPYPFVTLLVFCPGGRTQIKVLDDDPRTRSWVVEVRVEGVDYSGPLIVDVTWS